MIGPDKELKILSQSNLMQVIEYQKMVSSLQRFKNDLAVRSLTGKKNIRNQKTQDSIFYSVLEKMLLEVAAGNQGSGNHFHHAEQQLLALRKVHHWFHCNKHVLHKTDGYFPSARKITEDIYSKKNKLKSSSQRKISKPIRSKRQITSTPVLKPLEAHLTTVRELQRNERSKSYQSGTTSSMFAPSPTQDLTSVDTLTLRDQTNYQEDLIFARENYEREYGGLNKTEHLNRPMTAPSKLKPHKPMEEKPTWRKIGNDAEDFSLRIQPPHRPQSAISKVTHDLSWAKFSPAPLTKLMHRNSQNKTTTEPEKQQIHVVLPSEDKPTETRSYPTHVTDPSRIANLVLFKEFCLQHAAQQETHLRQYINHKHETRQHFLEFPENRTEHVVRETAQTLGSNDETELDENAQNEMMAYRGMPLEEFLNGGEVNESGDKSSPRSFSAPASLTVPQGRLLNRREVKTPPISSSIQQQKPTVTMSSVFDLVGGTGKQMNTANQQALSAPKHGWRYPMVPVLQDKDETHRKEASGVLLALQEGSQVHHKVMIPLNENKKEEMDKSHTSFEGSKSLDQISPRSEDNSVIKPFRQKSFNSMNNESAGPSRSSSRPQSSPRYFTGVSAVYKQYKVNIDDGFGNMDPRQPSRSSNKTPTRPKTAASWCSNPANSEVSRTAGAASHHSIGMLKHRSVAQSMRVRSVTKYANNNSRDIHSGRSSASSYVAQLREKRRAGAISSFSRPAPKKKELPAAESPPPPQLSFVNIVAPMRVPNQLTGTKYAAPGGVYCGSTAAVAIATEYTAGRFNDDVLSDDHLSYEDYGEVTNEVAKSDDEKSETPQDNWLSHWLSGGPLELENGATNYADLVSRAAIFDSSGERSYSDDVSSNAAPALEINSPKEDFSLTPRSDPLLSHRTKDTSELDQSNADGNDHHNIPTDAGSPRSSIMSSGSARSGKESSDPCEADEISVGENMQNDDDPKVDEDHVHSSSDSSTDGDESCQLSDDQSRDVEDFIRLSDEFPKDVVLPNCNTEIPIHLPDEGNQDDASTNQVVEKREDTDQPITALDGDKLKEISNIIKEDFDKKIKTLKTETEVLSKDSKEIDLEGNNPCNGESDSIDEGSGDSGGNFDAGSDDLESNASTEDLELKDKIEHHNTNVVCEDSSEDLEMESSQEIIKDVGKSAESNLEFEKVEIDNQEMCYDVVKPQDNGCKGIEIQQPITESMVNLDPIIEDSETGVHATTTIDLKNIGDVANDSNDASGDFSDSENASDVAESPHAKEDKNEYFVNKGGSITVVITSPEKVERMLKRKEEIKKKRRMQKLAATTSTLETNKNLLITDNLSQTVPNKSVETTNNSVQFNITSERHVIVEIVEKLIENAVHDAKRGETPQMIPQRTSDINENMSLTNMITRDDMSGLASISRPTSGRPIPSETDVRDPFVEFVASTRQKQVVRNTNVQTIFKGSVNHDAYKKFDLEERRMQEERREAAVMMQRAYRKHLARTRAARKCPGINPETLQWARAYKAKLKERRENRQRRVIQSRSSGRTSHKKEMQKIKRIGPHTNVYEIYHPGPSLPSPALVQDSAVEIQRFIRGWLVRNSLSNIKKKMQKYNWQLSTTVNEYRETLRKTQLRHGRLNPLLALTYAELNDYLEQRKKFEMMFQKRQFWNEMEETDLHLFFQDCDLYPSNDEIEEALEIMKKSFTKGGKKKKHSKTGLHLHEVLEIAFHIFAPIGAHLD